MAIVKNIRKKSTKNPFFVGVSARCAIMPCFALVILKTNFSFDNVKVGVWAYLPDLSLIIPMQKSETKPFGMLWFINTQYIVSLYLHFGFFMV